VNEKSFILDLSFILEFSVVNKDSFVRELNVQLWSVNQRTMEAEEVTAL
jgi:hypothetical protein